MSENSIDVDVNFHLNDINNLFKMALDNVDFGIFKKLDEIENSSLISDINKIEEQDEFLKTLNDLKVNIPVISDIMKIMDEFNTMQDEDNELIKSTQDTVIKMFSTSKLMLKMLEEKYPLSDKMMKEIDDMQLTLSNQKLAIEDKIDIISRSINNLFAPFKEERQAFKAIPKNEATILQVMEKSGKNPQAVFDVLYDFASQISSSIQEMVEKANKNVSKSFTISKGSDLMDRLKNIDEIATNVVNILNSAKESIDNFRLEDVARKQNALSIASTFVQGVPELKNLANQIGDLSKNINDLLIGLFSETKSEIGKLIESIDAVGNAIDDSLVVLNTGVEKIDEIVPLLRKLIPDVKAQIRSTMKSFEQKVDDAFFGQVFEEMFTSFIEKGLAKDPRKFNDLQKVNYLIELVDSLFGRLFYDFGRLTKSQMAESQKLGITEHTYAIPTALESAKKRRDALMEEYGILLGDVSDTSNKGTHTEIKLLEGLINSSVAQSEKNMAISTGIKDNVDKVLEKLDTISTRSSSTLDESRKITNTFGEIKRRLNSLFNATDRSNKNLKDTREGLIELLEAFGETIGYNNVDINVSNLMKKLRDMKS